MKLEKIDSSNERDIRRYSDGLIQRYVRGYDARNEKGFKKYLAELRKKKEFKAFEKLATEVKHKQEIISDMKKSMEELYGIEVSSYDTCSENPFGYKIDYHYDYTEGRALKNPNGRNCDYQKTSEIQKAILEKNVAKVNELISELEEKAGVQ